MVQTVKMSQFIGADLTVTTNKLVGVSSLSGGYNFQTLFINTWTTSTRPSPPYPGLSGYNSTTKEPEFWNGTVWISLAAGTGTVNAGLINQLAWYASTGNAVSGLATLANGVLVTSSGSVPSISMTLPSLLNIPSPLISYSNGQNIKDNNDNTLVQWGVVASAVNFVIIANSVTNSPAIISVSGSDTNVGLQLQGKGIGGVAVEGVGTNNSAAAGYVGEFVSSTILAASAISLTSTTVADVTSISLTAGDWDVWGNVTFLVGSSNAVSVFCWINNSSSSFPDAAFYASSFPVDGLRNSANTGMCAPQQRFSLATTTTIYLSAVANFPATCGACGGIYARRRR